MSRASELMDSRKFMAAMDTLIDVWGDVKSGATDEQMAEALQAVLDMACPELQDSETASEHIARSERIIKQRGIKALIPVAETPIVNQIAKDMAKRIRKENKAMMALAESQGKLVDVKPKRKRRTKAEMAAAKGEESPERPLRKSERITPPSEDENQKQAAPHIVAMLAKVQARADAIAAPTFDVSFDRNEGMFIQELPMYLEAGGKFGVIENKGFNPQYGWVVKIGRK